MVDACEKIPVFFTFDNNYAAQCGVTFESLLYNAHYSIFYELYVITSGLDDINIEKLYFIVNKYENASLHIINANNIEINCNLAEKIGDSSFTKDTLYRCIPTLFKEFDKYDKIIYSDVDIIVLRDISKLYHIDVKSYYLAGFKTPYFLSHETTHLSEEVRSTYFGGGLWVMNLKKIREDNLCDKVMKIIKDKNIKLVWNDQDIMNIVCAGNVTYFSYEYVSIPHWKHMLEKCDYYDEIYQNRELEDAMMRPAIIHYAGYKPWIKCNTPPPKYEEWFYWLSKTPFSNKFQEELQCIKKLIKYRNKYKILLFGFIPLGYINFDMNQRKFYINVFKILRLIKFKRCEIKE